jgi:AhpD family alkylhydroperoxidase
MTSRINLSKHLSSTSVRALLQFSNDVGHTIDRRIAYLVQIRASQINGCAYCLDMHTKEARAHGETEQRIYALSAWRETPFFTDRERAALEWTESLTQLPTSHPSDDVYRRVAAQFSEDEIMGLTFAVIVINAWNRLVVPFHPEVGSYQPAEAVTA